MPIAFPFADIGVPYAPDNGTEDFAAAFDITNLGLVGSDFSTDALNPGMPVDGQRSQAVNLRNLGFPFEAIDFGARPNPVPRPLPGAPSFVLQTDWAQSNASLAGTSRDSAGAILANCTVHLFASGSHQLIAATLSGAAGEFSFGNPGTGPFYLRAYLPGSPDVAGTTSNQLFPAPLA